MKCTRASHFTRNRHEAPVPVWASKPFLTRRRHQRCQDGGEHEAQDSDADENGSLDRAVAEPGESDGNERKHTANTGSQDGFGCWTLAGQPFWKEKCEKRKRQPLWTLSSEDTPAREIGM